MALCSSPVVLVLPPRTVLVVFAGPPPQRIASPELHLRVDVLPSLLLRSFFFEASTLTDETLEGGRSHAELSIEDRAEKFDHFCRRLCAELTFRGGQFRSDFPAKTDENDTWR